MSDCIEWTRCRDPKGYGRVRFQGEPHLAHRVAFFEKHGYWPNICRHTCDNPPCINTDHLVDGDHQSNTDDMMSRGRHVSGFALAAGVKHYKAKLTPGAVKMIRWLASHGYDQREIASAYGVHQACVNRVHLRKSYKEV